MSYTVTSIGTTPEEVTEIRTWMPWMRSVQVEMMSADRNYGGYEFECYAIAAAMQPKYEALSVAMRESDCADCRSFAGISAPSHNAPVTGHRNHCTCSACWG